MTAPNRKELDKSGCRRRPLPSSLGGGGGGGLGLVGWGGGRLRGLDDDLGRLDLAEDLARRVHDLDHEIVGAGLGDGLEVRERPLDAGAAALRRDRVRPAEIVFDDGVLAHHLVGAVLVRAPEVAAHLGPQDGVA